MNAHTLNMYSGRNPMTLLSFLKKLYTLKIFLINREIFILLVFVWFSDTVN